MQAFEVQELQITGDPPWAESALWDLTAKVEDEPRALGPTDVNPRLRSLLADRFALKTHRETQQQPVFALVIIDRTSLSAEFDFEITFSPDSVPDLGWPGNRPTALNQAATDPSKPSLFVALEEQLGLRLESTKGPVEMLVIDHVEKPSEN